MNLKTLKNLILSITLSSALCCVFAPLSGCSSAKDVVYLQNIQTNVPMMMQEPKFIKLKPGDKLRIVVHSRDSELVEMFNLRGAGSSTQESSYYTVDDLGQIEMPIIGIINVKGLTRLEVANVIKYKLLSSKLIRDPIVSVEYFDMAYYMLGSTRGRYEINRDHTTLLEALAQAGDMDITGTRKNILVLRTEDGKQTPYRVDITNVESLYSSPAYYIQQDDVIYVEPNETAVNAASPNGNSWRTPTFWMGMFNFAISMVLLFSK